MQLMEIKVSYQAPPPQDRIKVECSKDAARFLKSIWSDQIEYQEEMYVVLLNRANEIIGYKKLSSGGMSGCLIDMKILFGIAVQCAACGIILAHNHPSGNLAPSEADIRLTKQVKEASKLLDICLLDHQIITVGGYNSMADCGYI
ncbi:JAB domain-containing protein [Arundinibacter roseus]|uniref:DNA repair protein n=1 Tax=Arundinibacter roseus TaxID=2070510 RepID=A0A4R4KM86_9BACT|nr:JAB domain-containing protein [Arundinibacter roseus]TDB69103.1 DNA repair protein [Arundinibacter roseus]